MDFKVIFKVKFAIKFSYLDYYNILNVNCIDTALTLKDLASDPNLGMVFH